MLEIHEINQKAQNIYSLIEKDFTKITRVCLFCADDNYLNEEQNYNIIDSNQIDIIDDINNGNFYDLYSYITPNKCCHSFHNVCWTKYNFKNKNIKSPENCIFCRIFLTLDNMNKFGCFLSERNFTSLYPIEQYKYDGMKKTIIMNIEKVFYSKIDSSPYIDLSKKDKLLKLKKINQKFLENYNLLRKDFFKYYKTNYNNNLVRIEEDLDNEIREKEEDRKERIRERREYENDNRPIPLKRCSECRDVCFVCFGSIKQAGKSKCYMYGTSTLRAHNKCLLDGDRNLCCLCRKNKGIVDCTNTCHDCIFNFKDTKVTSRCYYCKKMFN